MKGWLDKYQGGGNVAVSDATRTKVTKNTGIKKGADQPVSNMLDITLNAPQRQLVKMITGKEQYPSEAMGIKNPYGAFAADAILDPTNLVGAGLLGKAAKASTKTGVLSNAYKINPFAFKPNETNWYRQVGDAGFQDAIKTGTVRGVNEDISRTMLDKIDEPYFYKGEPFFSAIDIKPTGNQSDKFLLEGNLSPSDFIPAAGDNRWIKHMYDLSEKGLLNNFEFGVLKKDPSLRNLDNFNIYKKNWLQGYKEVPKKKNGGWLEKYNDGGPVQENYNDYSVSAPEGYVGDGTFNEGRDYSPAWGGQFAMGGSLPGATGHMYARYEKGGPVKRFMQPTETFKNIGYNPLENGLSTEYSTSIGGPGEVYLVPRYRQGRILNDPEGVFNTYGEHLGGPFKTVQAAEDFAKFRHDYVEKNKNIPTPFKTRDYKYGGLIPGDIGFSYPRTIDPAPDNGPGAKKTMASAQNGAEMRYYQEGLDFKPKGMGKNGKVIKDDMGQWAHPGEITEIGSNQITMQGVPYPVLGISDTGDMQMMYPDEEYEYDGESVTEYPMMKEGGALQLTKLDQLTNFTNYNTKQPGGWLDKYQ